MGSDFLSSKPVTYCCLSVCGITGLQSAYTQQSISVALLNLDHRLSFHHQEFEYQSLHTLEPRFFFHPFAIIINQTPGGLQWITCLICMVPTLVLVQGKFFSSTRTSCNLGNISFLPAANPLKTRSSKCKLTISVYRSVCPAYSFGKGLI